MKDDQRNMFMAIGLSLAVVFLWQFLFLQPDQEQARLEAEQAALEEAAGVEANLPIPGGSDAAQPLGTASALILDRAAAIRLSNRVIIDTPSVDGSISLTGARIDDLHLRLYHETIEEGSPEITLMSPSAAANARYAELGWRPSRGAQTIVPDSSTEWQPLDPGAVLTPQTPVTLVWSNGQGLNFIRTFSIDENYMFTITQSVTNSTSEPVTLHPYGLVAQRGEPEGRRFWISYEGPFGYLNGSRHNAGYGKLRDDGAIDQTSAEGWLGITDKYWMTVLVPPQDSEFVGRFTYRDSANGEIFQADYIMNGQTIPAGGSVQISTYLFAGAKVVVLIDQYRDELGILRFDLAMDWGWLFFLTKPFFWALSKLGQFTGNFGVAILLFTVLVKLVFFPLANKSYESMSKMRKVQPDMEKLRERYKDDKVKQQQELMELYKREKLNPLAGCLPMVVQIPVFFALYQVLFVTIEMRHAPFFGWIQDLSAPDPTSLFNLFGLLPWSTADMAAVPFIGPFLTIGAFPIVMGFSMWFQMQLNPPPPDPVQRRMFQLMPIFFTFLLANFSAGLVIYWAWNNMLSILQQTVIMRRMGVEVDVFKKFKLPEFVKNAWPAGAGTSAGSVPISGPDQKTEIPPPTEAEETVASEEDEPQASVEQEASKEPQEDASVEDNTSADEDSPKKDGG